jgi:hypothetical protein
MPKVKNVNKSKCEKWTTHKREHDEVLSWRSGKRQRGQQGNTDKREVNKTTKRRTWLAVEM